MINIDYLYSILLYLISFIFDLSIIFLPSTVLYISTFQTSIYILKIIIQTILNKYLS